MDQHGKKPKKDHVSNEQTDLRQNQKDKNSNDQRGWTNTIALGVLAVACAGLIGFEIASNRNTNTEDRFVRGSKSLQILSENREREGAGLIHSLTSNKSQQEHLPLEALKETNKVQSGRIKALKTQLIESNQKLHEIKGHLFMKGDPSDRSHLAGICQDLVEKERLNNEYRENITQLREERVTSAEKINRMEHTIDALAEMTDTQRTAKEEAITHFQGQIKEIQTQVKQEKDELFAAIDKLEEAQHVLKNSLAEKISVIKSLEDETTWQYGVLEEKKKEVHSQAELFAISEKGLNGQLQDLIASMEIEILKNHNLNSDLRVVSARESAQHQYSKELKTQLLQSQNRSLADHDHFSRIKEALIQHYLEAQGLLDVYASEYDRFTKKQWQLGLLFKKEEKRVDKLQEELKAELAKNENEQQRGFCLEEEIHNASQEMTTLQEKLFQRQTLLDTKTQEFETLSYSQASLRDQLQEKIHQLTAGLEEEKSKIVSKNQTIQELTLNIELEKTRSQEMNHHLKDVLQDHEKEILHVTNLERDLILKGEIFTEVEHQLHNKQQELGEHKQTLTTLTANLDQEKTRTKELHEALVNALEENKKDQLTIRNLEDMVEEDTNTLSLFHDRLEEKKNQVEGIQEQLKGLSKEFAMGKMEKEDIDRQLTATMTERDAGNQRNEGLQLNVQNKSKEIQSLQESLSGQQRESNELSNRIKELTEGKLHLQDLQKNLKSIQAKYEQEESHSQSLKKSLNDHENQILALIKKLEEMTENHEFEQERAKNFEQNLLSACTQNDEQTQLTNELEQSLLGSNQDLSFLKETVQGQQEEIHDLHQDNATLKMSLGTEKSRSLVLHQANGNEIEKRVALEKKLQEALHSSNELDQTLAAKNQTIDTMHTQISQLSEELEQTVARTLEFNQKFEDELSENKLVSEALEKLRSEKTQLEQKYSDQLNLLQKQQEIVDQLSQDLLSKESPVVEIKNEEQQLSQK